MRRLPFAMLVLLLAGCAPTANPFGRTVLGPSADEASLDAARHIDRIERLLVEGDLQAAASAIDEALAAGHQHPRLYFLQGRLHAARGSDPELVQAAKLYEQAIGQSPHWVEARIELADVYLRLERLASAESVYHDLDRLAPDHPIGPYGRGYVALLQGRDQEARSLLEEALRRDPDHPETLYARASLAGQDADPALQRRLLERFLVVAPSAEGGWRAIAELELKQGRREAARRAWERAYQLKPTPAVARRLAELARMQGDAQQAADWSQRAGVEAPPAEAVGR